MDFFTNAKKNYLFFLFHLSVKVHNLAPEAQTDDLAGR